MNKNTMEFDDNLLESRLYLVDISPSAFGAAKFKVAQAPSKLRFSARNYNFKVHNLPSI